MWCTVIGVGKQHPQSSFCNSSNLKFKGTYTYSNKTCLVVNSNYSDSSNSSSSNSNSRYKLQRRQIFGSTWKTPSGSGGGGGGSMSTTDKLHQAHFERRLIRTSPEKLFAIVADVDKYKEFVPYCTGSRVLSRKGAILEAELAVGFALMEERYTSIVTLDHPKSIKVAVTSSSLFHYLTNSWEFEPGPEPRTCWTSFAVAFKFRSSLHRTLTDIFFNEVQKRMLFAFEQRAKQLESMEKK